MQFFGRVMGGLRSAALDCDTAGAGAFTLESAALGADEGVDEQGVQLEIAPDTVEGHPEPASRPAVQDQGADRVGHHEQPLDLVELAHFPPQPPGGDLEFEQHALVGANGRADLGVGEHGLGGQAETAGDAVLPAGLPEGIDGSGPGMQHPHDLYAGRSGGNSALNERARQDGEVRDPAILPGGADARLWDGRV